MYPQSTTLVMLLLVGLASCQPPPVLDFDQDSSGYEEYAVEEDDPPPQQTRRKTQGEAAEAVAEPQDLDNRQTTSTLSSIGAALISLVMRFVGPLLTNLGIGTSNAILATMLRKRLTLIPEARKSMAVVFSQAKLPSVAARAL